MKPVHAIILLAGGLALISLGAWWERSLRPAGQHVASREAAIRSQAAQGKFPVVMVGDSLVEGADLPLLCGGRVLNAGVSGAQAGYVADFAIPLIAGERPRLVIVNAGLNDAHRSALTTVERVADGLARLKAAGEKAGARVVILGLPPLGRGDLAVEFSADHARAIDARLRSLGAQPMPRLPSRDGVHPTAAGYAVWKQVVARTCG